MSALTHQPSSAATDSTDRSSVNASVFLQPIAAPSVLGFMSAASGFLLFGLWFAGGGLSGPKDATVLFPFLLLFSGVGQLSAGIWSLRARDAVGVSLFGVWGGFWIGYGLLWLVDLLGAITLPPFAAGFQPLGQVFIYMAVITWTTAAAALARNPLQCLSQAVGAAAATLAAIGLLTGSSGVQTVSGWVFVSAAALFYYHAAASMINALFGRVLLPHFSWRSEENQLGAQPTEPIEYDHGEPGVKVGQ